MRKNGLLRSFDMLSFMSTIEAMPFLNRNYGNAVSGFLFDLTAGFTQLTVDISVVTCVFYDTDSA